MTERVDNIEVGITADISDFENKMKSVGSIGSAFGRQMTRAFAGVAFEGKKIGDVLKSLALQLSKIVFKSAFKPVNGAAGNGFSQILSQVLGFAHGGIPGRGKITPFASGGVINSPMAFPLGQHSIGLAGEAGPEAIIPLARGRDGRLGVRSDGGSGVNVTFHVNATDADSFMRSQSQISAMLYRAVSQGQRNL